VHGIVSNGLSLPPPRRPFSLAAAAFRSDLTLPIARAASEMLIIAVPPDHDYNPTAARNQVLTSHRTFGYNTHIEEQQAAGRIVTASFLENSGSEAHDLR
jgi:hypothetical protein